MTPEQLDQMAREADENKVWKAGEVEEEKDLEEELTNENDN